MISKTASFFLNQQSKLDPKGLTPGKGSGDFLSAIRQLMNPAQEKTSQKSSTLSRTGLPLKKGHNAYLESLRKGLLVKGKPLTEISLRREDLFLLRKFLHQCGFSQENVEKFLKELAENNPKGDINLSQFFMKINELSPSKGKTDQSIALDPSAIPHIESALRYFGLTPRQVDHTLSDARVKGGGLDLRKLLVNLKETWNQTKGGAQETIDQNSFARISSKLERLGIQMPNKEKGDPVSLKDLITALEQKTEGTDKGHPLASDVKTTIEQISERAVPAHEKDASVSSLLSLSRLKSTQLSFEEKMGKKGTRTKGESLSSTTSEKMDKGGKPVEKEGLIGLLKTKGNTHNQAGLFSDSDALRGFKGANKEEGNWVKSQTRIVDIPHDTTSGTLSETINAVKQDQKPLKHSLPPYLINHVGKQIARSIRRGERVIRLQLRPPELGTLRVEMDMKDNILKLGMITENNSVKELLLSNAHELREALVQQGVKLEKLDVQIHYDFGQSLADLKDGQKEGQRGIHGTNGHPFAAEGDGEDPLAVTRIMGKNDHLLDLVA